MLSMRSEKPYCALPRLSEVSQTTPLERFRWSFLSFQGRLSSDSSFHASLLQAIDGVMSSALCPQKCLKLLNASDLPRRKQLMMVALPASVFVRSFPFIPACSGQCTYRNFRRWISIIDTFQSGLPILLFTFCSEGDGMCCPTVTS